MHRLPRPGKVKVVVVFVLGVLEGGWTGGPEIDQHQHLLSPRLHQQSRYYRLKITDDCETKQSFCSTVDSVAGFTGNFAFIQEKHVLIFLMRE